MTRVPPMGTVVPRCSVCKAPIQVVELRAWGGPRWLGGSGRESIPKGKLESHSYPLGAISFCPRDGFGWKPEVLG